MKKTLASIAALSVAISLNSQTISPSQSAEKSVSVSKAGFEWKGQTNSNVSKKQQIQDLMSRLSIDDKVNLVIGTGMIGFEMLSCFEDLNPIVGMKSDEYMVPGAAGSTTPMPKYGLPAVIFTDGPAGVRISPTRKETNRTFYATGFPVGSLLSCTWDVELTEAIGKAIGNEALEY